jgi:protein TonB
MHIDNVRGAVMFKESLVESASLFGRRSRWPVVVSIAIETAVVAALVVYPLLHPQIVHFSTPPTLVFAPPPVRQPPPPPIRPIRAETPTSTTAPQVVTTQRPQIFRPEFQTDARTLDLPQLPVGINLGDGAPSPLAALDSVAPRTVVRLAPAPSPGPLNVSTGVMAGRLIEPIRPQYPAIAQMSRSEGTVVVTAIISKTGAIVSARVESGPPMLRTAALDAVKRARYRPFLLNGQPTDVETTISIVFRIGS